MTDIQDLAALIERHTGGDGDFDTAIPGISLHRASRTTQPHYDAFEPAVCIVAQGRKQMFVGDAVRAYDACNYLVISLDIPVRTEIIAASPDTPLLCAVFRLDASAIGTFMIENDVQQAHRRTPGRAVTVSPLTDDLVDTVVRLVRLLDAPADIPVLAPLVEKELLYRLLRGAQSAQMRQIAFADSKLHRVSQAITWIRRNFDRPMTIEVLATEAGMSRSGLYRNFQAVTGVSPLQYQKQIRLQEARRIMLRQDADSATAGYLVGYDSPSQFNREYRRLFGAPPHRDIAGIKAAGAGGGMT